MEKWDANHGMNEKNGSRGNAPLDSQFTILYANPCSMHRGPSDLVCGKTRSVQLCSMP